MRSAATANWRACGFALNTPLPGSKSAASRKTCSVIWRTARPTSPCISRLACTISAGRDDAFAIRPATLILNRVYCIKEWNRVGKGVMVHIIAVAERGKRATLVPTHINVQPEQWWVDKFEYYGYQVIRNSTRTLFSPFDTSGYLVLKRNHGVCAQMGKDKA